MKNKYLKLYNSLLEIVEIFEWNESYFEAFKVLDTLLLIEPCDPKLYEMRGWLFWMQSKNELAKTDFYRSIDLGDNHMSYLRLAQIFFEEKDYFTAIDYYNKVLEVDQSYGIYLGRGLCYKLLEISLHAIKDFSKAIELKDSDTAAYFYRAQCFFALLEFRASLKDFEKVLELNPEHTQAKEFLDYIEEYLRNK